MMKILEKLKHIDILGKEVRFKIENSELYKTSVGGFVTILMIVTILATAWFFGKDFF